MEISRRTVLKIAGIGALVISFLPRVAFAARNSLLSLRTGVQPGGKTRLVIETSARPSYSLSYPPNQLVIDLSNTAGNSSIKPSLASDALVKSLVQNQDGDKLQIVAMLSKSISQIPKNQIMVLEPNGDNQYRLVFDFTAGTAAAAAATIATTVQKPKKIPIIVIDAGHGGKDPGCIGVTGIKEKDVVLKMAKKLKAQLESKGFQAYLTRDTDIFLNLDTRAGIAEKNHADLFVSLHANANPSRAMKGFSIYTLSKKASDEEAQKLADAENAADKIEVDGFAKFEPNIRDALSALQQHAVSELSVEFAADTVKSLNRAKIEEQPGPALRQAAFAVLRSTIPGALIETGHLSNADEEKLLNSDSHQNKLVKAIAEAIGNYNFEI